MRPVLRWILVLSLGSLAACRPTRLAGESVGHYEVRGELLENTCGAGHPAPEQLWFFVELRHLDGAVGYWKLSDAPLVEGTLARRGEFRFAERREVVGVPTDQANGVVGCMLAREESIEGSLFADATTEAGVEDASLADGGVASERAEGEARFEAGTTIRVSPAGGDCSALLLPAGGAFDALPCEIRYSLGGERLAEPLW